VPEIFHKGRRNGGKKEARKTLGDQPMRGNQKAEKKKTGVVTTRARKKVGGCGVQTKKKKKNAGNWEQKGLRSIEEKKS